MREPRYLNLVTKCIWPSLGGIKLSGSRLLSSWKIAKFRVAGKNIHSVLDFVVEEPMCIDSPKHAQCLFSRIRAL
jgi:hypothetical protein